MRYLLLLSFVLCFSMCKTKDVIPQDKLLKYVVVLNKGVSPKVLKKGNAFDLVNYDKLDKEINRWSMDFNESAKNAKKLATSLLNHPEVVSVMSWSQYEKKKMEKEKKSSDGKLGKAGAAKQ